MKQYRVDTFSDFNQQYFNTEEEAVQYGKSQAKKGKVAFLLRHIADCKYDVVSEIK